MSVKIIYADTFDAAAWEIYRRLGQKKRDGHNILIVPDKFSLSAESRLLARLDLDCTFDIEVMSFNRFAATSMKNKINRCLTPEGSVMLLRQAALMVNDMLTVYKDACKSSAFPREIYAVITALRNSGVQPESLIGKLDTAADCKLSDVGVIYKQYLRLLEEGLADGSSRAQAFADHIPDIDGIENCNIFITDFYEFTETQYDILARLIPSVASVTIGLVAGAEDAANVRLTPTRAAKRIKRLCAEAGISCDDSTFVSDGLPEWKKQILKNAFAYTRTDAVKIKDEISLFVAPNIRAEVERVARTIRYAVCENGARYKDIAVVTSDSTLYAAEIKSAFSRFEIPYFLDIKVLFSEQPAAKFILSAMRAAQSGFAFEDVNCLIKNPFFYGDDEGYREVEKFENHCLKYSIAGLDAPLADAAAEKIRQKIIYTASPFISLKKAKVKDFAAALLAFAARQNLADKCAAFSEAGEGVEERASAQIFEKFLDIVDELTVTLADVEISLFDFIDMLDGAFQNVKIALVPLYLDSVYVGNPDESRYDDVKLMFIVGAIDGKLPAAVADTAVLGFSEEAELLSRGVEFYPTKTETVKNNLFFLIHLLLKPQKQLFVSYPASLGGSECKPSELINQLTALFEKNGEKLVPKKLTVEKYDSPALDEKARARAYAYKFATKKNGFYTLLNEAASGIPAANMQPYDAMQGLLTADDQSRLDRYLTADVGEKPRVRINLSLERGFFSASQMECYFSCPYKHYFAYGLKLKPRREGKLKTMNTGTLTHAAAEAFVSARAYENPAPEVLKSIASDAVDEVLKTPEFAGFTGKKHVSAFVRLKKECVKILENLAVQIAQSDFKPFATEAEVGKLDENGEYNGYSVTVDGKKYRLMGFIDRLDGFENYFAVIDYKSYDKDLSYRDIYNGLKIQPVLYMTAVKCEHDDLTPVALLYQPVSVGYKKEGNRFKMKGIVVDDPDILKKLDNQLTDGGTSDTLPVALKNDGTVSGKNAASVVPVNVFHDISLYTTRLVENAINEILVEGNINPSPVEDACEYCDFCAICPYENDELLTRKGFPKINPSDFSELYNGRTVSRTVSADDTEGDDG